MLKSIHCLLHSESKSQQGNLPLFLDPLFGFVEKRYS